MKASELIVKCLENEGVVFIFGVPGEEDLRLTEDTARCRCRLEFSHA